MDGYIRDGLMLVVAEWPIIGFAAVLVVVLAWLTFKGFQDNEAWRFPMAGATVAVAILVTVFSPSAADACRKLYTEDTTAYNAHHCESLVACKAAYTLDC